MEPVVADAVTGQREDEKGGGKKTCWTIWRSELSLSRLFKTSLQASSSNLANCKTCMPSLASHGTYHCRGYGQKHRRHLYSLCVPAPFCYGHHCV